MQRPARQYRTLDPKALFIALAAIIVLGSIVWQAVTSNGVPNPEGRGLSPTAVVIDSGILVFREGLEAVLVLAAVTASLARGQGIYWRAIAAGAALAFVATIITWFVVVAVISAVNAPALYVQAVTGVLAIVVLLVIMNWFFHKVYWTGWISHHNKRKREIMERQDIRKTAAFTGMALLGFTAIYREGFEVVLFLQNLRLKAGSETVLNGAAIGVGLSIIVAVLTFLAHNRLPFKKMLVLTGVLLGVVLIVMVGESVQELQLAGWVTSTHAPLPIPEWTGVWFAVFPTWESLAGQLIAAAFVIGSYFGAQYIRSWKPRKLAAAKLRLSRNL